MKVMEIFADRGAGHSFRDSGKPIQRWHVKYKVKGGMETKTMKARSKAEIKEKVKELGGDFFSADAMGVDD